MRHAEHLNIPPLGEGITPLGYLRQVASGGEIDMASSCTGKQTSEKHMTRIDEC